MRLLPWIGVSLAPLAAVIYACGTHDAAPGGAVVGPVDTHCGTGSQATSQAACQPGDAGVGEAAGDADTDGPQKHEEPAPLPPADAGVLFNQSGSDEECKYDFGWTSTPIALNENVTFTLTVKSRADKQPALGADPQPEVFLDSTHPAPNSGTKTTDKGNGVYEVGPIRFDRTGFWTVRFHVYDGCVYGVTSPHGHVAFYVNVP